MQKLARIQDAFVGVFPPPPVLGLGTIGGFKLQVEDRADLGYDALYQTVQEIIAKAANGPALARRVHHLSGERAAARRRTSIASRPSSRACRSATSSRRCRFISARST